MLPDPNYQLDNYQELKQLWLKRGNKKWLKLRASDRILSIDKFLNTSLLVSFAIIDEHNPIFNLYLWIVSGVNEPSWTENPASFECLQPSPYKKISQFLLFDVVVSYFFKICKTVEFYNDKVQISLLRLNFNYKIGINLKFHNFCVIDAKTATVVNRKQKVIIAGFY